MQHKGLFSIGLLLVITLGGCGRDHLDPTQIGRFRPIPSVNVILDSLGVAEESSSSYEGAEDPRPADAVVREQDYIFSSGDVARIAIFELLQESVQYVDNFIINESGNISIPEIGQIQAEGLTEEQLEDEIRSALSPGILKNPSVTVSLMQSQSRVFSINGDGVAKPGRYGIPRYDYRLMDALADAGSARQFNVSYIYVTRRITGDEPMKEDEFDTSETATMPKKEPQTYTDETFDDEEMLKVITPAMSTLSGRNNALVMHSAEMITDEELASIAAPDGLEQEPQENSSTDDELEYVSTSALPQQNVNPERIEWVFKNGKWTPVSLDRPEQENASDNITAEWPKPEPEYKPEYTPRMPEQQPETEITKEQPPADFGWNELDSAGIQARVIKIPKDKLFGGDPRYNIVIKPGDTITVQLDIVGEFYMLGNVNNQGVINLTGRPMTLKMAIASAGGLGPLAWPKKCEVIRRIGEKKEEIVMVDLNKIANGTQPDFFIKPNDVINVGTHGVSRWMAILRNAFRATYGFGFIYDRNFADRDYLTSRPFPNWF